MVITDFITIDVLNYLLDFVLYFIFSFIGSLLKEIHNTNTIKGYEFQSYHVISSTIIASLITIVLDHYFSDTFDHYWGSLGLINFVIGLAGFDLFQKVSSVRGLLSIFMIFQGTPPNEVITEDNQPQEQVQQPTQEEKKETEKPKEHHSEQRTAQPMKNTCPKVPDDINQYLPSRKSKLKIQVRDPLKENPKKNKNQDDKNN